MKVLGKIFIPLLIITYCKAQNFSISGTITDQENGETLIGAAIQLLPSKLISTTNQYGFFSITAPKGTYTLVVSYTGYKSQYQPTLLNATQVQNFSLMSSQTNLAEVEVSTTGTNENIKTHK